MAGTAYVPSWPEALRAVSIAPASHGEAYGEVGGVDGEGGRSEDGQKNVRMAYLAVVASKNVNGVAAIHAEIVKSDVFPQFVDYYAKKGINDKFIGITNGVTCRRWLALGPLRDVARSPAVAGASPTRKDTVWSRRRGAAWVGSTAALASPPPQPSSVS